MSDIDRDALLHALRAMRSPPQGYDETTAPVPLQPLYKALAPSPDAEYGSILPVARNRVGSADWVQQGDNTRFAMPGVVRSGLLGVSDLLAGVDTGQVTPRAAETLALGGLGSGAALAPSGALAAGAAKPSIRAYHGSPHNFDRFDIAKIGTGEGAQAYGHGLYFAENEAVARGYRDQLSGRLPANWMSNSDIPPEASAYVRTIIGDIANGRLDPDRGAVVVQRANRNMRDADPAQLAAWLKQSADATKGHMYEVNINADPARFLDWDNPLKAQSPEVIDQVNRAIRYKVDSLKDDMRGGEIYNRTASLANPRMDPLGAVGIDKPSATQIFSEAGIPGIRYLDQGSRAAQQGTSNYVVFDPSIVEIMRKYGIAAPAPVAAPAIESEPYRDGGAIANAMNAARKARAEGGPVIQSSKVHVGPIHSAVAGRTDHLPVNVPSGAYVIPADIISAMGEGNTMAGFKVAENIFKAPDRTKGMPYGMSRAAGGSAQTVPIVAAGGEYVISPEDVVYLGDGDLEDGHRTLDQFVTKYRAKTVKTLKALPPPRKD